MTMMVVLYTSIELHVHNLVSFSYLIELLSNLGDFLI